MEGCLGYEKAALAAIARFDRLHAVLESSWKEMPQVSEQTTSRSLLQVENEPTAPVLRLKELGMSCNATRAKLGSAAETLANLSQQQDQTYRQLRRQMADYRNKLSEAQQLVGMPQSTGKVVVTAPPTKVVPVVVTPVQTSTTNRPASPAPVPPATAAKRPSASPTRTPPWEPIAISIAKQSSSSSALGSTAGWPPAPGLLTPQPWPFPRPLIPHGEAPAPQVTGPAVMPNTWRRDSSNVGSPAPPSPFARSRVPAPPPSPSQLRSPAKVSPSPAAAVKHSVEGPQLASPQASTRGGSLTARVGPPLTAAPASWNMNQLMAGGSLHAPAVVPGQVMLSARSGPATASTSSRTASPVPPSRCIQSVPQQ